MSNRVSPELIEKFKRNIILPMYRQQGWNIGIDTIGISFDLTKTMSNLPSMNIMSKGNNSTLMIPANVNGRITMISLPSPLGFGMLPPRLESVISSISVQVQKLPESRPNLSFFDLPSEQNSGGEGILNALSDALVNRGRE
jgi:hypothetical protein